jgi:hypothetical protein
VKLGTGGATAVGYSLVIDEDFLAVMMSNSVGAAGDKIGIWGVDLHCESEYAYQRPNLEYLIGLARGRGIKVFIPPHSALLSHAFGVPYGYWCREGDVGANVVAK